MRTICLRHFDHAAYRVLTTYMNGPQMVLSCEFIDHIIRRRPEIKSC